MATTLYFLNTASPVGLPGQACIWSSSIELTHFLRMDTSRGSGVTSYASNCVNGPTPGVGIHTGTILTFAGGGQRRLAWVSDPIDTDTTISGSITYNLRALESAMTANVAINARVFCWHAAPAANTSPWELITTTGRTTELGTSEAAANFSETPDTTTITAKKGDRLVVEIFGDDAGTMSSGNTFTFFYNGTTGGASGDSFITFNETFGFLTTTPAGTTLYHTDTAGPTVSNRSTKEMWTSRGSGVTSKEWGAIYVGALAPTWSSPDGFYPSCAVDSYFALGLQDGTAGTNGIILGDNTNDAEAQSFVPSSDHHVHAIIMPFVDQGGVGSVHELTFRNDNGSDRPGSTVYYTHSAYGLQLVTSPYRRTYLDSSPTVALDLTNGTKYWWQVKTTTANGLNYARLIYKSGGGGNSGGKRITDDNGDGTFTDTTDDLFMILRCGKLLEWYSKQLQAFTLSGLIAMNLRIAVATGAQAGLSAEVAVTDNDGTNVTVFGHANYFDLDSGSGVYGYGVLEPSVERVYTFNIAGDDISVADGQRLRFRVRWDRHSDDVATGETGLTDYAQKAMTVYYNGTSGGASGDSYITLSQSVSEYSAGGGSVDPMPFVGSGYYPTQG